MATDDSAAVRLFLFSKSKRATRTGSIINVGGPGCCGGSESRQKGWTVADDVTFTNINLAGDHTLKFGASYGSITLTKQNKSDDLNNATYSFAVTPNGVADTPFFLSFPNLKGIWHEPRHDRRQAV